MYHAGGFQHKGGLDLTIGLIAFNRYHYNSILVFKLTNTDEDYFLALIEEYILVHATLKERCFRQLKIPQSGSKASQMPMCRRMPK